jgi:small membrane protein
MQLSQVLIVLVIIAFGAYAFRLRTLLADRFVYLFFAVIGVILAAAPDLSTWVANLIGVGRGVDLLLYMFVLFSLFHFVTIAARLRLTERQITILVRMRAIETARTGTGFVNDSHSGIPGAQRT